MCLNKSTKVPNFNQIPSRSRSCGLICAKKGFLEFNKTWQQYQQLRTNIYAYTSIHHRHTLTAWSWDQDQCVLCDSKSVCHRSNSLVIVKTTVTSTVKEECVSESQDKTASLNLRERWNELENLRNQLFLSIPSLNSFNLNCERKMPT